MSGEVTVWLVDRTYSDDEQNLIILTYSTPDGSLYVMKERALSSFAEADNVTAAIDIEKERLSEVRNDELRERYSREASRMMDKYNPDETV